MSEFDTAMATLNPSEGRPTFINWQNQVETIVDGYRNHMGLAHGVQKDAIQNAWDARASKKGDGWAVAFELAESPGGLRYFTITDSGTTGLTGRVLLPEELTADLDPEERWGRFENLAFTKGPSEEALGSRGRGKFIFVGASKKRCILYDSLRCDGTYRFGLRQVKLTESPVFAYDGEDGEKKLSELTNGFLKPLDETGTRIIIVDPVDELVDAVMSGEFTRAIGETWWELLLTHEGCITLATYQGVQRAAIPAEFTFPSSDTRDSVVWLKERSPIRVAGEDYRIKRLHIVKKKRGSVPDDLMGVAIQRGGMKVCSVAFQYVPKEIKESVYGYVTFDRKLDQALRQYEGIEHYSFDFRRALPKAVKQWVEGEMNKFAKEKLGLGVNQKELENQRRSNAERRSLYALNRITKRLGLLGFGPGTAPPPPPPHQPQPKGISLSFLSLDFPGNSLRVDYGQSLTNITIRVTNRTESQVDLALKVYVFNASGSTIVNLWDSTELTLDPETRKEFGPAELLINRENYVPGEYSIRALLVSMGYYEALSLRKGHEIAKATRRFFVEEDPPEKGLFEDWDPIAYPDEINHVMAYADRGERGGYRLSYNTNHPAKKANDSDEDSLTDYLLMAGAIQVPRIVVRQEEIPPGVMDLLEIDDMRALEDPEALSRAHSTIFGKIMEAYYSR